MASRSSLTRPPGCQVGDGSCRDPGIASELYAAVASQDLGTIRRLTDTWTITTEIWMYAYDLAVSNRYAAVAALIRERILVARFDRPVEATLPIQTLVRTLVLTPLAPEETKKIDSLVAVAVGRLLLTMAPALGVFSPALFQSKVEQFAARIAQALQAPK
jgi:hypothetical protein